MDGDHLLIFLEKAHNENSRLFFPRRCKEAIGLMNKAIVHLVMHIATVEEDCSSEAKDVDNSTESLGDKIDGYFQKMGQGVPLWAVDALRATIDVNFKHVVECEGGPTTPGNMKVSLNFENAFDALRRIYSEQRTSLQDSDGEARRLCVPGSHFCAMVTASIFLFQHLQSNHKTPDSPADLIRRSIVSHMENRPPEEEELGDIAGGASGVCEAFQRDLMTSLVRLEVSVLSDLEVPAFDCLHEGTFLKHLRKLATTHSDSFLRNVIDKYDIGHSACGQQQLSGNADFGKDRDLVDFTADEICTSMLSALDERELAEFQSMYSVVNLLADVEAKTCLKLGQRNFAEASGGMSWLQFVGSELSQIGSAESEKIISLLHEWNISTEALDSTVVDESGPGMYVPFGFIDDAIVHSAIQQLFSSTQDYANARLESISIAAKFLVDHFKYNSKVAKLEADKVFNGNASSPEASSVSDCLRFEILTSSSLSSREASDQRNLVVDDPHQQALLAIASTPLGASCADHSLWSDVFEQAICPGESMNLLNFIGKESAALENTRDDICFLAVSLDDVIPVERKSPSSERLAQVVESKQWNVLGAWCLAASLSLPSFISLSADFQEMLHHQLLTMYERAGTGGTNLLFDICLSLTESVARKVQGIVLEYVLRAVQLCCRIDNKRLQDRLVKYSKKDMSSGSKFRLLITAAVTYQNSRNCDSLSTITSYLKDLNASHIAQKAATSLSNEERSLICRSNLELPSETISAIRDDDSGMSNLSSDDAEEGKRPHENDESPKAAVEKLLVSDFGYSAEGKRPDKDSPQTVKLRNALEHLSVSLYGSDVHFVMELVQNADDNTYEIGVCPTIKIELFPDVIVIYNNEVGFKKENIIAICNVGGSTKKGVSGYIGQKGIGFKSVFTISNFPQLHSNGYHIGFDREYMIEPKWLEQSYSDGYPNKTVDGTYFETCFRLPLDEKNTANFDQLTENLEDVYDENLLLFLNKLERMVYEDRCNHQIVKLHRISLGRYWTQLKSERGSVSISPEVSQALSSEEAFWFIRKRELKPEIRRADSDRAVIDHTEVAVAIKFIARDKGPEAKDGRKYLELNSNTRLPLYAYLPTKTTMFNFIIQGDFLLSTSRESILENSTWNRYLMGSVPGLIVQVLCEFARLAWAQTMHHTDNSEILSSCHHILELNSDYNVRVTLQDVVDILPLPSEDTSVVYRDLVNKCYAVLKEEELLCSAKGPSLPSKLVYLRSLPFDVTSLVSEELLFRATGCRYIHDDYDIPKGILDALGVESFSMKTVMACLNYINDTNCAEHSPDEFTHAMWSELSGCLAALALLSATPSTALRPISKKSSGVPKTAPEFVPFKVKLAQNFKKDKNRSTGAISENLPNDIKANLKRCRIWPASSGQFVALESNVLFMRTGKELDFCINQCIGMFPQSMFQLLDDRLFGHSHVTAGEEAVRRMLLRNLRVDSLTANKSRGGLEELVPGAVVRNIILPVYVEDEQMNMIDRPTAAAFLAFLFLSRSLLQTDTDVQRAINHHGVICPVMSAREHRTKPNHDGEEKASGLRWTSPQLVRVGGKRATTVDVHLGIEFRDSATSKLARLPISTALRQLDWLIVDPLVFSLMFNFSKKCKNILSEDIISHDDAVRDVFEKSRSGASSLLKEWRTFQLEQLRVVNFFGLGDINDPAPGLMKILLHLLRNKNEVRTVEVDLESEIVSNMPYLPLFLPCDDEKPCVYNVTFDMHRSMMEIAQMIDEECEPQLTSCKHIADALSSLAWFPVNISTETLKLGHTHSGGPFETPLNIITTPKNICIDGSREFPHMCVPAAGSNMLSPFFHRFVKLDEKSIFDWITKTRSFYTTLEYMAQLYDGLYRNTECWTWLKDFLNKDIPFLWLPDHIEDDSEYGRRVCVGNMYCLSRIVKNDPSQQFNFAASPLRSLEPYTRIRNGEVPTWFARKRYCSACKAREGMFGVRGIPIDRKEDSSELLGNQSCMCIDQSFGAMVPHKPGLVKDSPSAADSLSLLKYYRESYITSSDDSILEVNEEGRKASLVRSMRELLESFSREIWKCFNIDRCLHPYSARDLTILREGFQKEALLLTLGGDFVCAESSMLHLIVVDDRKTFDLFQTELAAVQSRVDWVDGLRNQEGIFSEDAYDDDVVEFDLEVYNAKCTDFLGLDTASFQHYTGHIPPKTFFAPRNILALAKFLDLKILSEFIVVRWEMSERSPEKMGFVAMMNDCLRVAQAFLYTKQMPWKQVGQAQRMEKLFGLKVRQCGDLKRIVSLSVPFIDIATPERSHASEYYFDSEANVLLFQDAVSFESRRNICVHLISKAIQIELALLTLNQNNDKIEELRRLLLKLMYGEGERSVKALLGFAELEEVPSEDNKDVWKLVGDVVPSEEDAGLEEVESSLHTRATEAYQNLKQDSLRNRVQDETKLKPLSGKESSARPFSALRDEMIQSMADGDTEASPTYSPRILPDSIRERVEPTIVLLNDGNPRQIVIDDPTKLLPDPYAHYKEVYQHPASIVIEVDPDEIMGEDSVRGGDGRSTMGSDFSSEHKFQPPNSDAPLHQMTLPKNDSNVTLLPVDNEDVLLIVDEFNASRKSRGDDDLIEAPDSIIAAPLPLSDNEEVGRLGERIAFHFLQQMFESDKVIWKNRDIESFAPFDFVIERKSGIPLKCEVKTHYESEPGQKMAHSLQWFVSAQEIECAIKERENYFCILIVLRPSSLQRDRLGIQLSKSIVVGLENGLVEALRQKDANLLIQV